VKRTSQTSSDVIGFMEPPVEALLVNGFEMRSISESLGWSERNIRLWQSLLSS
jgi:hypothetical protein